MNGRSENASCIKMGKMKGKLLQTEAILQEGGSMLSLCLQSNNEGHIQWPEFTFILQSTKTLNCQTSITEIPP